MSESTQQVLTRVRPPRVKITYDVEIGNAIQKKELPFIVGILADLSGKPETPLPKLKERKFVEIDRDNFDTVLEKISPRLAFRSPNRMQPDTDQMLNVLLAFSKMEDFSPVSLVQQVPALKELYDARNRLRDLLAKLDGNDELDGILTEILESAAEQAQLREELKALTHDQGSTPDADPPAPAA